MKEAKRSRPAEGDDRKQQPNEGKNDSSSLPASAPGAAVLPSGGTYPHPTNFPERLMHVLENEIAPKAIWWLGEKGDTVAIHPQNIKDSPVLNSHFQGNRYTSFVRNMNRWGFRRISYYAVPETVVAYHNSLFQKHKPALVKYMEMDSDIQDLYERHLLNIEKKGGRAEDDHVILRRVKQQMQQQEEEAGQQMTQPTLSSLPTPEQQLQHQHQQQAPNSLQNHVLSLLQGLATERQGQQNQGPSLQQSQAFSSTPEAAAMTSPNLAALLSSLGREQQLPHQVQSSAPPLQSQAQVSVATVSSSRESRAEEVLARLIPLVEQFLELFSSESQHASSIKSLLQLLVILWKQSLANRSPAPTPAPTRQQQQPQEDPLQQLLMRLQSQQNQQQSSSGQNSSTLSMQLQQMQSVQPQQTQPLLPQGRQVLQQQQNQQDSQATDGNSNTMRDQLLMLLQARESSSSLQRQQQQQQPERRAQQPQGSPNPGALQQLIQQLQQQPQGNQEQQAQVNHPQQAQNDEGHQGAPSETMVQLLQMLRSHQQPPGN